MVLLRKEHKMAATCNAKMVCGTAIDTFGISVSNSLISDELSVFNSTNYHIFPGFCDVHVHFREPGFSYKETIRTGSQAAARGGYTSVCRLRAGCGAADLGFAGCAGCRKGGSAFLCHDQAGFHPAGA